MSATRHVRIELPAHGGGKAVVEVDGADVAGAIRGIEIRAGVNQTTDVFLDLAATPVTLEGRAEVWIPAGVLHLLGDYGWHPPAHAVVTASGATLNKPPAGGDEA